MIARAQLVVASDHQKKATVARYPCERKVRTDCLVADLLQWENGPKRTHERCFLKEHINENGNLRLNIVPSDLMENQKTLWFGQHCRVFFTGRRE